MTSILVEFIVIIRNYFFYEFRFNSIRFLVTYRKNGNVKDTTRMRVGFNGGFCLLGFILLIVRFES